MASIYEIQSNNTTVDLTAVYSLYAECATAAGTAAKVAKLTDANITSLISGTSSAPLKGMHLFVKFTYSNTVASPTLTVQNSAGTTLLAAKSMMQYGTTAIGTNEKTSWRANAVVEFVFDGTNWVEAYGTDDNDNTDTKQNITLATTSKAFVTGVTTTPTGTAQALTGVADTGVYLTTTAGQLNATTYKVNEAVTMQYNSTSKSLDFIFT